MLELRNKYGNGIKTFRHIAEAVGYQYQKGEGTLYRDDKKVSQKELILEAMKSGIKLDKWNTMKLNNCMTLAQRIADIKFDIKAGFICGYSLHDDERDAEHANASVYWMEPTQKQMELIL